MKKFSLLVLACAACLLLLASCKEDAKDKNSEPDAVNACADRTYAYHRTNDASLNRTIGHL